MSEPGEDQPLQLREYQTTERERQGAGGEALRPGIDVQGSCQHGARVVVRARIRARTMAGPSNAVFDAFEACEAFGSLQADGVLCAAQGEDIKVVVDWQQHPPRRVAQAPHGTQMVDA